MTFHYNSSLWSNTETFNLKGGETGFDSQETKLPTYWNTPFSKICLGMKIGHQINFIVINTQANSLYSLIADGQYRATSLGRNTWKTLIMSQASLQRSCNKEGFNVALGKARIRIVEIMKTTAILVIPESDSEQEGILMISTRVETSLGTHQMETKTSKPLVTSWCSDMENKKRFKKHQIMERNTSKPWDSFWCSEKKLT